MGILDLMLGTSGPGEQGVDGKSYTLSKATHDFVYPVAVRRDELEAFVRLLEDEEAVPSLEENTDELQDALDSVLEDHDIDATELAERGRKPRLEAEPVIEHWREQLSGDLGVVYARPGTYPVLLTFVKRCTRRDEDEDDPFELPETFSDAAGLLKRLEEATDRQYRAVVHTDLLANRT
ncbi:hypothetical protein EA462_09400 [Natrarchaeobius halalkaliphilus]|uniref:Uncharacterized protein n=1 Tax=Natrarchaeobius halalkaliphilus TaxID=1679091 RepID=A0A3N6LM92_9EURY|nr:hypothetical protein [Natrarchaeobius halalkaliphilus]RQG90193.1 hypothetical protein EA462_09400 [Natrarchaeobius halalkaliphilus]